MLFLEFNYTINQMPLTCYFNVERFNGFSLNQCVNLSVGNAKGYFFKFKTIGGFKAENLNYVVLDTEDITQIQYFFNMACNKIGTWHYCYKSNRNNLFVGYENNTPVFEPESNRFEMQNNYFPLNHWHNSTLGYCEIDYLFVGYRKANNPHTYQALTQFIEQNELHEWAYVNPEYVIECLKSFSANYDDKGSNVVFETAFKPELKKDGTMFKPIRSNIKFIGLFDKCRFKGEVILKFKYLANGTHKTEINFKPL